MFEKFYLIKLRKEKLKSKTFLLTLLCFCLIIFSYDLNKSSKIPITLQKTTKNHIGEQSSNFISKFYISVEKFKHIQTSKKINILIDNEMRLFEIKYVNHPKNANDLIAVVISSMRPAPYLFQNKKNIKGVIYINNSIKKYFSK